MGSIPKKPKPRKRGKPAGGKRTSLRRQLQVVAHYAASGNAKLASSTVGVSETTGRAIIRRAVDGDDPVLSEALGSSGAALRSYVLDSTERAMLTVIEVSIDRLINTGDWIQQNGLQADPGPAYAKAIVDAHKSLTASLRVHAELAGAVGPANGLNVTFVLADDEDTPTPVVVDSPPLLSTE